MTDKHQQSIWPRISGGNPGGAFIVAEIGKNFIQTEEKRPVSEYLENAKRLVALVKTAGADAVKFQTHNVEDEQLPVKIMAPHFSGDRRAWVTRNTLATPLDGFWKPLKRYCDELDIIFLSTPMSRGAAMMLSELGVDFWKVGSADILDFVMLDYLRRSGKPIIISSGMSTVEELDKTVAFLKAKTNKVVLLHCVSKYPCPPEELSLSTIEFLRERYELPVGFSDHSIGIDTAVAASIFGATVIEKHFSLDRALWGSDHKVSMTPDELAGLVKAITRASVDSEFRGECLRKEVVQKGMGTKDKPVMDESEAVMRPIFRKVLVAAVGIPAGAVISSPLLVYAMRPQQAYPDGLSSESYESVLGKRTTRRLRRYDPITPDALV